MGAYVSVSERQRRGNERAQQERQRNYNPSEYWVRQPGVTTRDFLRSSAINAVVNRRR